MYLALASPGGLNYSGGRLYRGLGDQQSAQQGASIGGTALASGAAIAALPSVGLISAAALPIIGAAIAGVTIAVSLLIKNSGCGQTCIETSQWANQAGAALEKNILAYFSNPVRYRSQQAQALANFDAVWARLVQMCSDPSTGNAGKRCISDRQAGSSKWVQTSNSVLLGIPGEPQPGQPWNWFSGYRDPIANDPDVQEDTVLSTASEITDAAGNVLQSVGVSPSLAGPLLIGALVLLGLWVAL